MYKRLKIIAIAPAFNEEKKIGEVVRRVPHKIVSTTLIVDDGSTDGTAKVAKDGGATVISLGSTIGAGAAIRAGYDYAVEHNYDIAVVMAGNNKDSPEEIPQLIEPIVQGKADFVQGSRYLKKNANFGPMPLYRKIGTRIVPIFFSLVTHKWVTESTNGFRAIKVDVLRDKRLGLHQKWLDKYELEPYLYIKIIRLGYRTQEVPVTKVYPPKKLGQTKIKPFSGWWSMLKPLVLMGLGIKK